MRRPLLTLVGALSALALTTALHAQNPTQESALLNHTRSHPSAHAVRRPGHDLNRDLRDLRRDQRDLRRDHRELGRCHRAGRHDRPGMRRVRRSHASPWI